METWPGWRPQAEVGWNVSETANTIGPGGSPVWVPCSGPNLPPDAVEGGFDNERLFVGRAMHSGSMIPGKVVPSHGVCYVAWGGQEHGKNEFEVLTGCNPQWVPVSGDQIPMNALNAGNSETGEPLYVGRVQHKETLTPGKVQLSHKVCYISYGGEEIGMPDYEVLVL